ncbi:N/A [soil metagenome]
MREIAEPHSLRIDVLDGWRAASILLVLAGHLLPIGPKRYELNAAVATSGMAIFFTLSGLLITRFLLERPDVRDFLIRRAFRIVPLAWVAMAILAVVDRADAPTITANFLFVSNVLPEHLFLSGEHLWSLCVEIQFYLGVAALVAVAGRRGLYLLPILCVIVTMARAATGNPISIFTWFRVDEILAGACLALLQEYASDAKLREYVPRLTAVVLLPILIMTSHPAAGALNYFRPYVAAMMVGASIYALPSMIDRLLRSRIARYIATISYAVYVVHGILVGTWLGSGNQVAKYAKRPLLILTTFAIAHASTFWFERPMIAIGKRLGRRRGPNLTPSPESLPSAKSGGP